MTPPPGVTLATEWISDSVTHRLPSGPDVIRTGPLPAGSVAITCGLCGLPTFISATLCVVYPTR